MECNKEEALRATKIAEEKMTNKDFEGARKIALKAEKLFPGMDKMSQILTVCDVHCSSQTRINNTLMDYYGILQVEKLADVVTIKKQYRKVAFLLHPDKNKFPGAETAFKLICEANRILSDEGKRCLYDLKCKGLSEPAIQNHKNVGQNSKSDTKGQSTFWIDCFSCKISLEYGEDMMNIPIWCPKCLKHIGVYNGAPNPPNHESAGGSNNPGRPAQEEVGKRTPSQVDSGKTPKKKSKVSSCGVPKDKIGEKNKKSKLRSDLKGDAVFIDCKDPQFANFDKEKEKDCFEVDQIWACYDPIDGMPRFYAQIREVYESGFRVRISWLEADPENPPEILWTSEGLPVSCGRFIRGESEEMLDCLVFSHRVTFLNGEKRLSYLIYPRKGEIWALFKDWDINWSADPKNHLIYKFEIVEVLSDFEKDSGVLVADVVKVKGFVGLFQKTQLAGRNIPSHELFRFSHRVPSLKLTGTERADVPAGSFELDTASLPDDLSHLDSCKNVKSSSGIHDFESDREEFKFREGEIWAIRYPEDRNCKSYAQIKKIKGSQNELHVDLLKLCVSNDMSRPNACGLYQASANGSRVLTRGDFLFLVKAEVDGKKRFHIYPSEKEIWVFYTDQDSRSTYADVEAGFDYNEYEVVEVVERMGDMIKVLCLSRVGGYKSVFMGAEVEDVKSRVLEVPCGEFNRFCYRVPAVLLTDQEGGRLKGCWELDLACVSGPLPS